ncbi:hypothetical protein LSH36_143g05057, partial [Paralvinella palmiformis]
CPQNQVYKDSMKVCGRTCETFDWECSAPEIPHSGCTCTEDLVKGPDGVCVEPKECPCSYNGRRYKTGDVVNIGCKIL